LGIGVVGVFDEDVFYELFVLDVEWFVVVELDLVLGDYLWVVGFVVG